MALWLLLISPGTGFADSLELKSGQQVDGEVIGFDGKVLKFRSRIGEGTAEVPYPLELVSKVRLQPQPALAAALAEPVAGAVPALEEAWKQRMPMLAIPETDSGEVGLALAKAWLATGKKKDAQSALAVLDVVRSRDWSESRKAEAARLRLTALAASGNIEQAMEEASKLEVAGAGDEKALAATRTRSELAKADVAWKKLLKLEEDWPKWREMPGQRAEHQRLGQNALDGYVFGATFQPELADLASEGLWKAIEAYQHLGQNEQALILAREIVDYFPQREFKPRADQLLKKNTPPSNKHP